MELKDLDVVEQLGRGSYGDVFRVTVLSSGEELAMKVVSVVNNEEPAHVSRTLLEVRTLHSSSCPYVVNFRGAFVDGSDIHTLMELMWGSLDALIELVAGVLGEDAYFVPEFVVGHVALAMSGAIRYLKKEKNVMHRDLKPANVLINASGEVKLCDLGISKVLTNSVTRTAVGSKAYMSPERLTEPEYDVRADVWSLGIVIVELVTGSYPYAHLEQPLKILTAIAEGDAPTLPEGIPYSAECKDFVATCLERNVDDRPKPKKLLKHPFLKKAMAQDSTAEVAAWLSDLRTQFVSIHGVEFEEA